MRLVAVDPGLDATNVLTMSMALPQADFYGEPERTTFCETLVREVGSLPGVQSVGAISHLPLSGANAGRGFAIEGRPEPPPDDSASAFYRLTCPGYFRTLGIPVMAGRDFTDDDGLSAPRVVIVNESAVEKYWPGENPLGKRIKFGNLSSDSPWLTIVGVVQDVRHFGLDTDAYREIYRPYSQTAWPVMTVTARTALEPIGMASAVRAVLRRIDPDQPVSNIRSMEEVLNESLGYRRFPMLLLGLFSGVAFALAAIGVYGVVNHVASQRQREIGIRMALGARRAAVVRLVLTRSLVPIGVGIAAGVLGAVGAARFLEALLFRVRPSDPAVLATIALVLGSAAILASWIPARRAAGVDPLIVLRQE
jgi:putative ABC transport system permease protein